MTSKFGISKYKWNGTFMVVGPAYTQEVGIILNLPQSGCGPMCPFSPSRLCRDTYKMGRIISITCDFREDQYTPK